MTVDYSLRTKRAEFRKSGIFYTPPELGKYMQSFLPPDITEIYDPTCGHGALLELFPDNVKKYGQEINPEAIPTAQALPNSVIVHGDTLTNPAFLNHYFRAIIANPPFSMRWTPAKDDPRFSVAPTLPPASRADFAFILHILHYLADDGVAAVIISGGLLYREAAEGRIRRWMVDKNYIDQVISIPADTFRDTAVATILLILKRSRPTTAITFSDKASGVSILAPREEVIKKSYNLLPDTYLPPATKKAPAPTVAESLAAVRKSTTEYLRYAIELDRVVAAVSPETPSPEPWLNDLQSVIDAARPSHEIRLKSYPVAKTDK